MYVYNADLWCDSCGEDIRARLDAEGTSDTDDSGHYPKHALPSETDSPRHCASDGDCLEAIDLRPYGAREDALIGAESVTIGELVEDDLTDDGVEYLREILDAPNPTPYQSALHAYWRKAFADYL